MNKVIECPYTREAAHFCNTLVNEIVKAKTWADMSDAISAINRVRFEEKIHSREWEHLNNPSPDGGKGVAECQPTQIG